MDLDYIKLKIYRTIQKRFATHVATLKGFKINYNDPRSLFSEYEIIFKNRAYNFRSPNQSPLIIDGGSHIGLSLIYFKSIYPNSRILAFEPDPGALSFLEKNIKENNLKNIRIIKSALSSEDGETTFEEDRTDGGKISNFGNNKIKTEKLSNYTKEDVDFLKLNIEGAELSVIKELESSGKLGHIKEMCLEWHSFAHQNQNLGGLLSILERNNFHYLINDYNDRINPHLKTPFEINAKTQYYLLIYAKRRAINE